MGKFRQIWSHWFCPSSLSHPPPHRRDFLTFSVENVNVVSAQAFVTEHICALTLNRNDCKTSSHAIKLFLEAIWKPPWLKLQEQAIFKAIHSFRV